MHIRRECCCLLHPGAAWFSRSHLPIRRQFFLPFTSQQHRRHLALQSEESPAGETWRHERRDWLFCALCERDLRLLSSPAGFTCRTTRMLAIKGITADRKTLFNCSRDGWINNFIHACVQCECLGVWVWESVLLHVCESVCQYSDWHKPRYMSRCWKNFSGMSGNELLFDWIHYTWAAIHNECCHATYLISRRTPAFQILSLNNMQKNCIFARMKRKSVFPWDVRNIIKYVIPISGLAALLSTIVDVSAACGECFLRPKRADAASGMICLERCRSVCMSPIEFSRATPGGVAAVIRRGTETSGYQLTT